jgi:hypothetical protein
LRIFRGSRRPSVVPRNGTDAAPHRFAAETTVEGKE